MRKSVIIGAMLLSGFSSAAQASSMNFKAIATGVGHDLALAEDGTVWAWGANDSGQLGDGTATNRKSPGPVPGLDGIAAMAAGAFHNLAAKSDGTVWAWGENSFGVLGDGTRVNRFSPVQVSGLSGVVAVAAGGCHSLALRSDGSVWAWGCDGTTLWGRTTPARINGLNGIVMIAAGQAHSLAVRNDGTVWAWGYNWYGQLGNGTSTPQGKAPSLPVQVSGLGSVVAISAGYSHSLAVKADGSIWMWGADGTAMLPTPSQVGRLAGAVSITAGLYASLAVLSDGTVWEWKFNSTAPAPISGVSGVTKVSLPAAAHHGLVLDADGSVWAWGWLGGEPQVLRLAPMQVKGLAGVTAVAAGWHHSLALMSDRTVWEWGGGWAGVPSTPAPVPGLTNVVAVDAGAGYSLALREDGSVWQWDDPWQANRTPVQVSGLSDIKAIAAGWACWDFNHRLALKADGTVWLWGDAWLNPAWYGRDVAIPVPVSGLDGVVAVARLGDEALALKDDGTVWQVGVGPPVEITGLSHITAIAGGCDAFLALREDGAVWQGTFYGTTLSQVSRLPNPLAVAVGFGHYLALRDDGTVWAWRRNYAGQLGDGTTSDRDTPIQVAALTGVRAIAAGTHSLAVKQNGTVWGWGDDSQGEVSGEMANLPVRVLPSPDLAIAMSHDGDFTVGGQGVYTVTITNVGPTATSVTITVTDILPPGLSYVSGAGSSWFCSAADEIVTCANAGPIDPKASSSIALTVSVEARAWPGVTNLAMVSNASDKNAENDIAGDPTVVLAGK